MSKQPTDTEIIDWIERNNASFWSPVNGDEPWIIEWGHYCGGKQAKGKTIREAAAKAMGRGKR